MQKFLSKRLTVSKRTFGGIARTEKRNYMDQRIVFHKKEYTNSAKGEKVWTVFHLQTDRCLRANCAPKIQFPNPCVVIAEHSERTRTTLGHVHPSLSSDRTKSDKNGTRKRRNNSNNVSQSNDRSLSIKKGSRPLIIFL